MSLYPDPECRPTLVLVDLGSSHDNKLRYVGSPLFLLDLGLADRRESTVAEAVLDRGYTSYIPHDYLKSGSSVILGPFLPSVSLLKPYSDIIQNWTISCTIGAMSLSTFRRAFIQ